MPLTLDQAGLAGQLFDAITRASAAITDLDARIADVQARDIGAKGSSMDLADGTSIRADVPLSSEEVVDILGLYRTVLVAKRDAAQAALDAITIA